MRTSDLRRLEAEWQHFLKRKRQRVSTGDLTPDKRAARRAAADKPGPAGELAFCQTYFPGIFDAPFSALHHHLASLQQGHHFVSGHRYSGKSAFAYVAKLIRPIVQKRHGIYNLCLRDLELAANRTSALSRMIQRNKLLMHDYEVQIEQDRRGYHIINDSILVATSYKKGLRSFVDDQFKRFRVSINDDLYNRTSVPSDLDNTRVTEFVTAEVHGQMEPDGLSLTLGNAISDTCPMMRWRKLFPDHWFSFPALNAEGQSNWPEKFTTADWEAKRATTPYDVWMGDYMDQPLLKGEIFDPEWLRFEAIRPADVQASISVLDLARGASPSACFKGVATLAALTGTEATRRAAMLDLYVRKESYYELFDYLHAVSLRTPAWRCVLVENDFAQWDLAKPYYDDWCRRTGKHLPIVTFLSKELATHERGADKESRILGLVHPHQTGTFVYDARLEGSPDYNRYRGQLLSFGAAKDKLDGPDAAASAYILLWRYVSRGTFKGTGRRRFKRPEWLDKRFR